MNRFRLIIRENSGEGRARKWLPGLFDVLIFICCVVFFMYCHHGLMRQDDYTGIASMRGGYSTVVTDDFTSADDGGDTGYFEFEGRFKRETPEFLESGDTKYYYDSGCEIAISNYSLESSVVRVADVYISEITRIKTIMANDSFGKGQREKPSDMATRANALFSITGDNYSERYSGVIMRNGVLYSDTIYRDVCVLYWNGEMEMFSEDEFSIQEAMIDGAYQIWSFGPSMLTNTGSPLTTLNSDVTEPMRRSAIGYYEPGHYAFVVMEGAVTLNELASTMSALGCSSAYALYGGRMAQMTYNGKIITDKQQTERECADLIYISGEN